MAAHGHGREREKGHARSRPLRAGRREGGAPAPRHLSATEGTRVRPAPARGVTLPLAVTAAGVAVLLVGVLGVRLLGNDPSGAADLAGSAQDSAAQEPVRSNVTPVSPSPSVASPRAVPEVVRAATAGGRTPVTARAALSQLMAGRALMTTRQLRATLRDEAALAAAAGGGLAGAAQDVGAVTRAYRGEELATELRQRLDETSATAVAFAEAVRDGDDTAVERTAGELDAAGARLGSSLERATGGAVPAAHPREDAGRLRAYVTAQARGDHAAAYGVERQLQLRQARQGAALAATLAGPVDAASAQQQELTGRWSLLLGEHAVLAGDVIRAGLTGDDDFVAATAALDANTAALAQAVGGVVPPEKAQAFTALWAGQIDGMVAYTRATAAGDAAGRSAAKDRVGVSVGALTRFFAETTGGRLTAASLGPQLERHAAALLSQADAWAASDEARAYAAAAADYTGLAGLAAPAADAFARTVAARAPVGGAATGWGGLSPHVRSR